MEMYDLAMEERIPSIQYGFLSHDFPLHEHEKWEIHLFTGGRGTLVQQGRVRQVSSGILTLTPPHHEHFLTVDESLSFYYLQFHAEKDISLLGRLVNQQEVVGVLDVEPSVVSEVVRLKSKLDSTSPDRIASGLHGFRSWLYDLAAGGGEKSPDGVDQALVWLLENLNRRLELDDLAAVAGLDRFSFSRRFKARTGLSPLAYVHRSKIEAAGFLLAGTDLPLSEVAQKLGFCDEFHFGRVFKKWRGIPPGQWRRSH